MEGLFFKLKAYLACKRKLMAQEQCSFSSLIAIISVKHFFKTLCSKNYVFIVLCMNQYF